jgi:SAM-dependent methyltransferase
MSLHDLPPHLAGVRDYYSAKIEEHGPSFKGVDWGSQLKHEERFRQLIRGVAKDDFSILDLGCGYGALSDFLAAAGHQFRYLGIDVSEPMIRQARLLHGESPARRFEIGTAPRAGFDYVVASGLFNVMSGAREADWERYVRDTMTAMFTSCQKMCAFNFLTSYADRKAPDLYYANPSAMLAFCIETMSKNVRLAHHYGIWDFTLQVYKDDA